MAELNSRFSSLNSALQGLLLLPHNLGKLNDEKIDQLRVSFLEDLPEPDIFLQEVRLWIRKWNAITIDVPETLSQVLSVTNEMMFPNIITIFRILTIIPVTSATVERGNSALKIHQN